MRKLLACLGAALVLTSFQNLKEGSAQPIGPIGGGSGTTMFSSQVETPGCIQYYTADNTPSCLGIGTANYLLGVNSGGTAPEWKASLTIATLNMTSATSSIPWLVAASTPGTFNVNGMSFYDSDSYYLIIRDQSNTRNLTFVPEGIATGGLIFGDSSPDAAGEIGYDGDLKFYDTAVRTVVATDKTQTLTNKSITAIETVEHDDQTQLTAAQVSGRIISNAGQGAADVFLLLPAAAAGYEVLFNVATAQSNHFGCEAAANDKIYLVAADGTVTAGDDAAGVVMTAAQVGQSFACWTFCTASTDETCTAWDWMCKAISIGTSTFAAHAHSSP